MAGTTTADIQSAAQKAKADSDTYHAIVHGGPTAMIQTDNGPVPSVARVLNQIAAQLVSGYAGGFVVVAANEAARLVATPAQAGQLLLQLDTKAIYYAPTAVMGSWVFHPVQEAQAAAQAATTAVANLTTAVGARMVTAAYVGPGAGGVVRTAEQVLPVHNFGIANAGAALHVYGVENGIVGVYPAALPNGAGSLVDGVNKRTPCYNTARRCLSPGTNFALLGVPRRLVSWGRQAEIGVLASGVQGAQSDFPRAVVARQQDDRPFPAFSNRSINTVQGQIEDVCSQGAITVALTADGLVLAAGAPTKGVRPLFGSGIDKRQDVFMPILFDSGGGVHAPIKMFDVVDSVASTKHSTGIFVDDGDGVWLLGTNQKNAGYGNGLVGEQKTPVMISAGYSTWSTRVVKKVRCDTSGNVYILFMDGELWAGGGANVAGQLGTGATAPILNPVQIQTEVTDFDVSGHGAEANLALWILKEGRLYGAGFNAYGQLGRSNYTNSANFVDVAGRDVDLIRIGGTANVTVIYRDVNGTFYGVGQNTAGVFGQGSAAQKNHTPVILTNLTTLVSDNGGLVDLCISGYADKHAATVVCQNGKAFAAGDNTDGALGYGKTGNATTWQEVLWSPIDVNEKIVDASAAVGPSNGPAFAWRTNQGRVLQAGSGAFGFVSGMSPAVPYISLTATPVQLGGVI